MDNKEAVYFSFLSKEATYEVIDKVTHGNKQQQIRYTTTIHKDDGWTRTYYEVSRSPQQVIPLIDNPYMEAIDLTSTLWQKLVLAIDSDGNIKKIVNLEEIQKYWSDSLYVDLTEMFSGSVVDTIVNQLDVLVKDEQKFIERIGKDTFFHYWLKHNIGDYLLNLHLEGYIKVGRPNHLYQIERTASKGMLIKGKGKKSVEELNKIKEEWELAPTSPLDYEEDYSCEYNRDSVIVKLSRKEVYTYQGSVYRSTETEIIKK